MNFGTAAARRDDSGSHWAHLRTTNSIESTVATVRTKGCGSRSATLSMVFKFAQQAQNYWRKLNGHGLLTKVLRAGRVEDGIEQIPQPTNQDIAA